MATVAQQTIQQSDVLDELRRDLVGNDESARDQRERHEQRERHHVATLAGEQAAARYRKLALCTQLVTDAEFRVLCLVVEKADADLTNSFASVAWLQRHLGGQSQRGGARRAAAARRGVRAVYKITASLARKQFLRWHRGRGWQLRLPEDVLAPGADGWSGPTEWTKRRARNRKEIEA